MSSEEFEGVAKFMTMATDDVVYLSHQVRALLSTTHDDRMRLFHEAPVEPSECESLSAGMLRALIHQSWPTYARSMLVESCVVAGERVGDLLACQTAEQVAFAHANFTNMCLALWMLTVTQFSASRQPAPANVDEMLDEFVIWTVGLRSTSGVVSYNEGAASFVFNNAMLYFLFQLALRGRDVKLKAIVLKAFFPIWFIAEPVPNVTMAESFESLATRSMTFFLNVQGVFTDQALAACQLQPTDASFSADQVAR